MIKGNEADITDIDFEFNSKRGDELMFYFAQESRRIAHIFITYVRLWWVWIKM